MEATTKASSISANSEEVVIMKEKDFKSKQDEASKSYDSHNHLEFVNLSKDIPVRKSKVREIDFLSSMKAGSSSSEEGDENNTKEKSSRTLSCIFCKGEFSTSQGYKQLGVRMDSMIQKPTYPRTPYSFGYGHGAMLWQQMLDTSNMEGTSGAKLRMEAGGGGSGKNNNERSSLKFGDSSTNRSTSSTTIMMEKNQASNKDEIHHSNIEETSSDSESSGLDLTLKL